MSSDNILDIDVQDTLKDVTLTITIRESAFVGLRLKAMIYLMRFAVWVGGLGGLEVDGD